VGDRALHAAASLLCWPVRHFRRLAGSRVSLIWAVHPLQTESVIYATQRTEGMAAFFYLATMYCSLRYWLRTAFRSAMAKVARCVCLALACNIGVFVRDGVQAIHGVGPLIVLLFDRTFISGSLANALRRSFPCTPVWPRRGSCFLF